MTPTLDTVLCTIRCTVWWDDCRVAHLPDDSPHDYLADCRIRAATDLLRHQWDPVVLAALADKSLRRSQLYAAIGQVAQKPLGEAIARLVAADLLTNTSGVLTLTALGRSFYDGPLRALAAWTDQYGTELLANSDDADSV
ncbi:winged helix-turn-helix transcriptional regulator [Gordonia sp. CPCC 205333]|uniref:winged helix-turn-helix transcriptional regulator n=1 Tax=Gordonia sp. CPCC 205333 TaxID=3140790 RepID=UPI003AF3D52F